MTAWIECYLMTCRILRANSFTLHFGLKSVTNRQSSVEYSNVMKRIKWAFDNRLSLLNVIHWRHWEVYIPWCNSVERGRRNRWHQVQDAESMQDKHLCHWKKYGEQMMPTERRRSCYTRCWWNVLYCYADVRHGRRTKETKRRSRSSKAVPEMYSKNQVALKSDEPGSSAVDRFGEVKLY